MTINRRQSVNGADYGILFGRIGEKRTRIFQHFSQIPCNPCIRIASVSPNFKQAWMCLDIQEVFQYSEQDLVEFVKSAFIYTAVGKRSERLELPVKVRVFFRFFFYSVCSLQNLLSDMAVGRCVSNEARNNASFLFVFITTSLKLEANRFMLQKQISVRG